MERHALQNDGLPRGISLAPSGIPGSDGIFTPEAVSFVARLARRHAPALERLLDARAGRRAALANGATLGFLDETRGIRESEWTVGETPPDLLRRHVEITGPVDRKMIINALNSGADCFMADFEDSSSPTWDAMVAGQVNLRDAACRAIEFEDAARGKRYRLNEPVATLLVRPRGLHLPEAHMVVDGHAVPAALFDFAFFFFHNAHRLLANGSGPYFYLPKLESHHEARWWNGLILDAQEALGLPAGTVKVTLLIETLPAAFEMDEILWELREHVVGLNCGRWDYIFSYIKTHRALADRILPDRSEVGMEQPFMRAYSLLLIRTCHRRGAHAMGGMAAQIPIKGDDAANRAALEKVRADKEREARDGHDGTWVAHPALVPIAAEIFAAAIDGDHQRDVLREDVEVRAADLLEAPRGERTEAGLRLNVRVGIRYLAAWLGGNGCVPLYHLMEDAATAEISRAQVWQWVRHRVRLSDDTPVTPKRVATIVHEELAAIREEIGETEFARLPHEDAAEMFLGWCVDDSLVEFLTLPAYRRLIEKEENDRT